MPPPRASFLGGSGTLMSVRWSVPMSVLTLVPRASLAMIHATRPSSAQFPAWASAPICLSPLAMALVAAIMGRPVMVNEVESASGTRLRCSLRFVREGAFPKLWGSLLHGWIYMATP